MKKTTKAYVRSVAYVGLFSLLVIGFSTKLPVTKLATLDTSGVEISYRAESPLGLLGGLVLPASCESGAWNSNGGYHLDGVLTDPGCAVTPVVPKGPIDGVCGSADGVEVSSAPTANLCSVGTPSAVTGSGPWNWKCLGQNGGKDSACQAPKQNAKNDPPEAPVISGDQYGVRGITTSNYIVATDPERDDVFYELDWDCNGSVDGTTGTRSSGDLTPIGHTYGAVGTYKVCGRTVQANDTTKRSGIGEYTIRITEGPCTSAPNACGVTSSNIVNGTCPVPALPAGYGNSCAGPANSCSMTNIGTIGCSGGCSETTAPSNSLCPKPPPVPVPPVPSGPAVEIISFSASPKLVAINRTSKLYWEVEGNLALCSISYTTLSNKSPVSFLSVLGDKKGQKETTPITEKRVYKLVCGSQEREATISIFSLIEI